LGHKLIVHDTKPPLFFKIDYVVDRVQYSHAMKKGLKTHDALDMHIFVDDTRKRGPPPPKRYEILKILPLI